MNIRKKNPFSTFWGERPQLMVTFFSVILFGLVAHGMGLFNKYSFHDDVFALFWVGSTISSGRWMLHVLGWAETLLFGDGNFSLPLTHGLFSFACIGLAGCLLVDLLKIKKKIHCAALGGLMVAFPVIAGYFGYMFTMPYYVLAMGAMVASAWLICKEGPWWTKLIAVLQGGCSVGTYQAFIPLLLSTILLYDMMRLSEGEEDVKLLLRRILVQGLCVAGVMAFYFAASRFFLAKFNLELNSYMGINQVGSTPVSEYLGRVGTAYREFFLPTRNVSWDMYPMHVYYMYLLMLCADGILAIRLVVHTWRKSHGKAILLAVCFALMPLGCNFIFVMSETVHGLMTYGQIAQFILCLWLLDRLEPRREKARRILSGVTAGALGLTCVMYARFDNQCYLKTEFQQQQAISYYTTLAARIKSVEGYRDDLPVAFVNAEHISDETLYNIGELDFIHMDPYAETISTYINSYAWRAFMERWCGFSPPEADAAAYQDLQEVREMPHYPDDGSIQNLGDVIVVNF